MFQERLGANQVGRTIKSVSEKSWKEASIEYSSISSIENLDEWILKIIL